MMRNQGFTLVEILIVVIILGILAAIVIPQFTEASDDARTSALSSDLQTVRAQLELYKMQHGGNYPAVGDVVTALTTVTQYDGASYGPYLTKFPINPFESSSTVAAAAAAGVGWVYADAATGKISPGGTNVERNGM